VGVQTLERTGVYASEQWLAAGAVEVSRIGDISAGPETVISREPLNGVISLFAERHGMPDAV